MPLQVNRMMTAIAIVVSICLAVALMAWVLVDVAGLNILEGLVTVLAYVFLWPLRLMKPIMPRSDSTVPNAAMIRTLLFLLAVFLDLAVYSLLTYVLLQWRARKRVGHNLRDDAA